jgi:hypothetical protein
MMTKKQLDMAIKEILMREKLWADVVKRNTLDKHYKQKHKCFQQIGKLLESIRDSQTTADGKIAMRGDEIWLGDDFGGVFSERVYVSSDCTDKPISATYSSADALKRAMKKARGK